MDVLLIFKIKIESQNLEHGCPSDHIQIKIKISTPSKEPPASSIALNQDLKDSDILCTFKIKIGSQNWVYQRQGMSSNGIFQKKVCFHVVPRDIS